MAHCSQFVRWLAALIFILQFQMIAPVQASTVPALIISEIKIRNDTAGLDEFIEIYNPTTADINLNEYFISYINNPAPAADQPFTKAVIADGLLAAGQSLVLAKNTADPALPGAKPSPFTSLSDSGGTLRILDAQEAVIDQFAWTSTQGLAVLPVQYLAGTTITKTQSFSRAKDTDGNYLLINPTWRLDIPSPQSSELLPLPVPAPEPTVEPITPLPDDPEPTSPTDTPPTADPPADTPEPAAVTQALPPQITELLPNPAAPASDSTDEYIELYNPNDQPLDLAGYRLQSGNTFSYSHTFGATILPAHTYRAFMVTETSDILSNTGGQARLLDPSGVVVAQTNNYTDANEGEAWALVNGAWQWTATPTPNADNILTLPILEAITPKTPVIKKVAAAKTTKTTAPKATGKVAAAKTTAAKPAKAAAERSVYQDPGQADITPLHPGILAGVGVMTVVYGLYEYRYDALNTISRLRRYRAIRRATRSQA